MLHRKPHALAGLALLTVLPSLSQAEIHAIDNAELATVSGQLSISYDNQKTVTPSVAVTLPNASFAGVSTAAPAAGDPAPARPALNPNPLLLPITLPLAVINGFNSGLLANAGGAGVGAANIVFAPILQPLLLVQQGVNTALDYVLSPISTPIDVATQTFDTAHDTVVDTTSQILLAPFNAVFGPVTRAVDGVTGRAQATVDGVAYAVTEVTGPRIAGAFANASRQADAHGLNFNALVFARIAQAQAGLTNTRLETLSGKYGY